jgi:hypothetical protein
MSGGIDRTQVFRPNIKANTESTKLDNLFVDVPKDATVRVRILPILSESSLIFVRAEQHYKMKATTGRGTALACLKTHGTDDTGDNCYLCDLSRVLVREGDAAEVLIGKDISVSPRWYTQVLLAEEVGRDEKNKPILKYNGPKLLGLPKTGADGVNTILNNMDVAGTPLFTEIDDGQDLLITRHSASPWYTVDRTGIETSLDDIFPDWEKKIMPDVYAELGLKVVTREEQKQAAMRAFGDELDWVALAEAHGL